MSRRPHILFAENDGWSLSTGLDPADTVAISTESASTPSEIAQAVKVALESQGYDGSAVAICVPSSWCLSATIATADLPRGDFRSMGYRLEESLPTAAENVVADFVHGPNLDRALGVAIRLEKIRPLVESLEAAEIPVHSVVPTALAAAENLSGQPGERARLILYAEPDLAGLQINLVALLDRRPVHWIVAPATESDLQLQLDLLATEFEPVCELQAVDLPGPLSRAAETFTGVAVQRCPVPGRELAVALTASVLAGRTKPWFNFRRGPLAIADPLRMYRKWIDLSLAAAAVLLLCLTAAFLVRASRYTAIAAQNDAELTGDFHRHFPTWQIPMNIPAVVEAQYRRSSDNGVAAVEKTNSGSALLTLRDVLTSMPAGQNVQIDRMSFHDNTFVINGRSPTYEQIDGVSKLVRGAGMVVAPSQTRQDADGTWTFTLQGSRAATVTALARGREN